MGDDSHVKKLRGGDQEKAYLRARTRGELHDMLSHALTHYGVPKELTEPEWLQLKSLPARGGMEGISIAYTGPANARMTRALEALSATLKTTRTAKGTVEPTRITLRAATLRKLVDAMEDAIHQNISGDNKDRPRIDDTHYQRLHADHGDAIKANPHWIDDFDRGIVAQRMGAHEPEPKPGSKPKPRTR